jgi:hypothetical protein
MVAGRLSTLSTKESVYASDLSDKILLNRTLINGVNLNNLKSDIAELNYLLLTATKKVSLKSSLT